MSTFPLISAYVYIFTSIFQIGFNLNNSPLISPALNRMESLNEFCIYISGMTLFLFTDWIPDLVTRYILGYFYALCLVVVMAINIGFVMYELLKMVKRSIKKRFCSKKVKKIGS